MTTQDFSSTVSLTPSFSYYVSGTVEAAVRVSGEFQSYNAVKVDGEEEFEFDTSPLHEERFFHFPTTMTTSGNDDVATGDLVVTSKNLFYGGWNLDHDESPSSSPSHSEDSEDLSPSKYYCFWSPVRSPARETSSTTVKSASVPRRCMLKNLLRRSHSDGSATTSSESKQCLLKKLILRRSHSDRSSAAGGGGGESPVSSRGSGSPGVKGKDKTASLSKAANVGEVDKRRKTYLPYRQDLIGVFAGASRFRR